MIGVAGPEEQLSLSFQLGRGSSQITSAGAALHHAGEKPGNSRSEQEPAHTMIVRLIFDTP